MDREEVRELIFDTIDDVVLDFVVYDRREDEELTSGSIEKAIEVYDISVDEMVERFRNVLTKAIDIRR